MIMPRGEELLLPVRPWFIAVTLVLGLLINMLLNMGLWGNAAWIPDLLAVVLVFWFVFLLDWSLTYTSLHCWGNTPCRSV